MNPDLPPALRQAVEALLQGVARKGVAERAGAISARYRSGGGSAGVVISEADAAAYALTRLPATYAAGLRAMTEAALRAPAFSPRSLLDAGAGPGGAAWAALETWPQIEAVARLDSNPAFLELAARLAADGPDPLRRAQALRGDLTAQGVWPTSDLVVASYALAEIPPARQAEVVSALWTACEGVLVLVEPGTPDGWRRILQARETVLAAGAVLLAPCPHAAACPVAAPDWCHFSQRLPRSREHRLAKGGDAPFEDEKFAYLAAARPQIGVAPPAPRVLSPPRAAKPGITLKLCTPEGELAARFVARRDKAAHAAARRLDWGDALPTA